MILCSVQLIFFFLAIKQCIFILAMNIYIFKQMGLWGKYTF